MTTRKEDPRVGLEQYQHNHQSQGNLLSPNVPHNVLSPSTSSRRKVDDPEYFQLPVMFEDISVASFRIRSKVIKTSCLFSTTLSRETGSQVYVKYDHLQITGSFKERGALNALMSLSEEQKKKGVIAASAGNHALGLSYHARALEIPVSVVMPLIAPLTKVRNCEELGASVTLYGNNIAESKDHAMKIAAEHGYTYVNGYDDPAVIAGAGTLGLEMLEQLEDADAVIVPIGGAGLIAGVALAMKFLRPDIKVIGVEAENCPSFTEAMKEGKPIVVESIPSLADGLAVPKVGENAFRVARKFVDQVILVSEKYIALAILRMLELEKTVVEGAGCVGIAALLSGQLPELKGKKVLVPLCGGNIDITVLGRVIERGLAVDGRLVRFDASISDRPGGLAAFTSLVAAEGASVKDLYHERAFLERNISQVNVRCVVETRDAAHAKKLLERLIQAGYLVDLSSTSIKTFFSHDTQQEFHQQILRASSSSNSSSSSSSSSPTASSTTATIPTTVAVPASPPSVVLK